MALTPVQNKARDKLAKFTGMTRKEVDAFYQYQDEMNELKALSADLLAALQATAFDAIPCEFGIPDGCKGDMSTKCTPCMARAAIAKACQS